MLVLTVVDSNFFCFPLSVPDVFRVAFRHGVSVTRGAYVRVHVCVRARVCV